MTDWEAKTIVLESDFIDIYIVPLSLSEKKYNDLKSAATEEFYDWFERDEVEAIGTEMERALERAGFKENVDYRMFFHQDDEDE